MLPIIHCKALYNKAPPKASRGALFLPHRPCKIFF